MAKKSNQSHSVSSGKPRSSWGFKLPPLPKDCYTRMQAMCAEYDMTQWQCVILALAILAQYDKAELEGYIKTVKDTYHAPWTSTQE